MIRVEKVGNLNGHDGGNFAGNVYNKERLAPTINTCGGGNTEPMLVDTIKIKQATKQGYIECVNGEVVDMSYPDSETRRGRVQGGGDICPTLTAEENEIYRIGNIYPSEHEAGAVLDNKGISCTIKDNHNTSIKTVCNYKIRKLTPKECWRLMDFKDEDFKKAATVVSNSQLYKQAGNSIVVNVLVAIIGQMIEGKEEVYQEG